MTPKAPKQPVLCVANYCRVSTDEQAMEGHSIQTQQATAREWCERHLAGQRYEITVYADQGISGKLGWEPPKRGGKRYRPELARLVADIEADKVDLLIVYRQDRLARSLHVWASFLERYLGDGKLRFVSLCENLDLSKSEGRLLANVLASFGSFLREIIAEHIREAHRRRRLEGLPVGVHYGWRSVPPAAPGARPTIEPDPERAPWVPQVYDWFLRGWGARRIARELELQGAPRYPSAQSWSRDSVLTLVQNPVNAGYVMNDGELMEAQHYEQRLIQRETYDAAQRELRSRQREGKRPHNGNLQPLYRIARCGICGQPLHAFDRCEGVRTAKYNCVGLDLEGRRVCKPWAKDARLLDRVVLKQLSAFVDRPEFQALIKAEARDEIMAKRVSELEEERDRLRDALARKADEERRLLRVHTTGKVSEEAYLAEYAAIQDDREALKLELDRVSLQLDSRGERLRLLAQVQHAVNDLPVLWEQMNPEERRHLLREIIEYCIVTPMGRGRHQVRVKFLFLPVIVEELQHAKSRVTGLFDDVAHLTPRELAYLAVRSDGRTDPEIEASWQVTPQAVYYLRTSVLRRLEVSTVEEAVRLARARIDKEREALPLGATDWHVGRPKSGLMRPRVEEALVRHIQGGSDEEVAAAMGITVKTVTCQLWHARHALGCASVAEAAQKYLELKGGRLSGGDGQPAPGLA